MRFNNTSVGISKWFGAVPRGERLGSLNKRQYLIDVYVEVDVPMCGKGACSRVH